MELSSFGRVTRQVHVGVGLLFGSSAIWLLLEGAHVLAGVLFFGVAIAAMYAKVLTIFD